ncbi:MAG: nitrile hydratase accessory protein [Pseudomonadota bacterium]
MLEAERPFDAPWQAQAFALAVALQEAGVVSAGDWARTLGAALAGETRSGNEAYWKAWLRALEALLGAREIAGGEEISGLAAAWQEAARATSYGEVIALPRREAEGPP